MEVEPPPLPVALKRALRLRAFNSTTTGALARTYATIRRGVSSSLSTTRYTRRTWPSPG